MKKGRIVISGFIGILPAGGVTWDYIQYPLGLSQLGYEVYYIEDTRLYPIYLPEGSDFTDATPCVRHLDRIMDAFGMKGRWAYRDEASGKCFGLSEREVVEICKSADIFINISCASCMREEYAAIPVRILVDSDPMFTQIQLASQQSFTPGSSGINELVRAHNYHFTFGENIGKPDCLIPAVGLDWKTTRQPVCLDHWKVQSLPGEPLLFTTLMNWKAGKILSFAGKNWGQKDLRFAAIQELPLQLPQVSFGLVVSQTGGEELSPLHNRLKKCGWRLYDAAREGGDWKSYRDFIRHSAAEFSVAKETYVKGHTGWFSCRSACYLASGRPVVVEETGWSRNIPSGKGAFAFTDLASAREAVQAVARDYRFHQQQARGLAEDYFDSRKVLQNLLDQLTSETIKNRTT